MSSKTVSVAQISYTFQPQRGGQEVYIDNLTKVIQNMGFRAKVYQRWRRGISGSELVSPVFAIPYVGRILKNWDWHLFSFFLWLTKSRRLKSEDLLILHYAVHCPAVWDQYRKSVILSHGVEWNYDRPSLEDRLREKIAVRSFGQFTIVANDSHYYRRLGMDIKPGEQFFSEVAPKKWLIPNCVNVDLFKKSKIPAQLTGKKIILVPRQITEDRGIHLAIEAFSLLARENSQYEMHVIGLPMAGRYFEYCVKLIRNHGLDDKVRFVGFVKNDQMPQYYSASEVTLIPTLRREGTSLSALESMACGTPTVSTNIAGLLDLPTIQGNPDAESLAEKMAYAINNKKMIGTAQRDKVREVFNFTNWENAWRKVIFSLLERKSD